MMCKALSFLLLFPLAVLSTDDVQSVDSTSDCIVEINKIRTPLKVETVASDPQMVKLSSERCDKILNGVIKWDADIHDELISKYIGENLFWRGIKTGEIKCWDAVNEWLKEKVVLINNYDYWDKIKFAEVGHYTQMIWKDSRVIGCTTCTRLNKITEYQEYLVICNFNPGGNVNDEDIFKSQIDKPTQIL